MTSVVYMYMAQQAVCDNFFSFGRTVEPLLICTLGLTREVAAT